MDAETEAKVHIVCVPYPSQGHITPMLKLAKLLHSKGFHITFVNMEYNHRRILKTRGPNALDGSSSFRFEFIPDGLFVPDGDDVNQTNIPLTVHEKVGSSTQPFVELLLKLNDPSSGLPPATHIISDCVIPFALDAAQQLGGLPVIFFWAAAACGFLGYSQFRTLLDKGIVPFKDPTFSKDGSLDMIVDWVPSMKPMTLKHLPSSVRITDKNDYGFILAMSFIERPLGSPIIINTFEMLEHDVLQDMSMITTGPIYTIGPIHNQLHCAVGDNKEVSSFGSNLWKEDSTCLQWLDKCKWGSVVYVSLGSIATMTKEELLEFAWGLANSNHHFLWIIRPDIILDHSTILPVKFLDEVKERSLIVSWCDQEQVLRHSSIGAFLTHCGWNSTLDSISNGVPLICWPFFEEQLTNCWYSCNKLGIGIEIDDKVERNEVEKLIREVMEGEKGKEMKRKAMEWKHIAAEAASPSGSSYLNFEKLINQELFVSKHHRGTEQQNYVNNDSLLS